jgi:hypothetical protein
MAVMAPTGKSHIAGFAPSAFTHPKDASRHTVTASRCDREGYARFPASAIAAVTGFVALGAPRSRRDLEPAHLPRD